LRESGEIQQNWILYHPVVVPSGDQQTVRVDIPIRIDRSFFVPERTKEGPFDNPFAVKGELLVELLDSSHTSVARKITTLETFIPSAETDPYHHEWIDAFASFSAGPGTYHVLVDLTDQQSKRNISEQFKTVTIPAAGPGPVAGSFVLSTNQPELALADTIRLQNLGSDFLYTAPGSIVFSFIPPADTNRCTVSFVLEELDTHEGDKVERRRDVVPRNRILPHSYFARLDQKASAIPTYLVRQGGPWSVASIPLSLSDLPLRDYVVTVTISTPGHERKIVQPVRAVWPDMPLSLKNVEMATEALRFLLPPSEIDKYRKGEFAEKRDSLESFWHSMARKTGKTATALMEEYYRRYDVAFRTYGTLRIPDGTRSDRGRIYVLFGPPTSTDRRLNPSGAFEEVWEYSATGRKFIFQDVSRNGSYVLVPSTGL
jgi:GWxTD domain-containing protein